MDEIHILLGEIPLVDFPSLAGRQGSAEHGAVGGEAQKSKHGDAAKCHGGSRLILPIALWNY